MDAQKDEVNFDKTNLISIGKVESPYKPDLI
jgi:hypothetical protein